MKYDFALCDLHPQFTMVPTTIGLVSTYGDHNTLNADRCPRPACTRHYTADFGYFSSTIGHPMDLGEMSQKPRCYLNHEGQAMVLTLVDGSLKWICPFDGCNTVQETTEAG
jgi:hypothetical protein